MFFGGRPNFAVLVMWFYGFPQKPDFTLLVKNLNLHFWQKTYFLVSAEILILWDWRQHDFTILVENMILLFGEILDFFFTKTWFCSFGRKHDFTVLEWKFEFCFLWKHLILRFWWKNSSLRFWQKNVNLWFYSFDRKA